jgi:hypothetical protein
MALCHDHYDHPPPWERAYPDVDTRGDCAKILSMILMIDLVRMIRRYRRGGLTHLMENPPSANTDATPSGLAYPTSLQVERDRRRFCWLWPRGGIIS